MNKLFLLIIILSTTLTLSAAYQYNRKGNQGWLTFDSTTTVSFDLAIKSRKDKDNGQDNYIDRGGSYNDYGWYNIETGEHGSFQNGLSATFSENDKIGFYVKDNAGTVYISTKPGTNAPDNVVWGKSRQMRDGYTVAGGNFGSNGTQEYYVFKVNTANNNNNPTPSGQPLPGIIATLVVGGGTVLYLKKRKKLYADK